MGPRVKRRLQRCEEMGDTVLRELDALDARHPVDLLAVRHAAWAAMTASEGVDDDDVPY